MATDKISPLAPAGFPHVYPVPGIRIGAIAAGIKYQGRLDLMVADCAPGSVCAGVYTQNSMPAAPVSWCKKHTWYHWWRCSGDRRKFGECKCFYRDQGYACC